MNITEDLFADLEGIFSSPEAKVYLARIRELALSGNRNAWPALVWFLRGANATGGCSTLTATELIERAQAADNSQRLVMKTTNPDDRHVDGRDAKKPTQKIPFRYKRCDSRAFSDAPLLAPAPLPHIKREALKKVKHALPVPSTCQCGGTVELVDNKEIYGKSTGVWPYAYLCRSCSARVGLHPNTDLPLGTLAGPELRKARNICKDSFESIWTERYMSRTAAYKWLAKKLKIAPYKCHFGLFDIAACEQAKDICDEYLKQMRKHL